MCHAHGPGLAHRGCHRRGASANTIVKKKKTYFDENANLVDSRNMHCQKTEVTLNRKLLMVTVHLQIRVT